MDNSKIIQTYIQHCAYSTLLAAAVWQAMEQVITGTSQGEGGQGCTITIAGDSAAELHVYRNDFDNTLMVEYTERDSEGKKTHRSGTFPAGEGLYCLSRTLYEIAGRHITGNPFERDTYHGKTVSALALALVDESRWQHILCSVRRGFSITSIHNLVVSMLELYNSENAEQLVTKLDTLLLDDLLNTVRDYSSNTKTNAGIPLVLVGHLHSAIANGTTKAILRLMQEETGITELDVCVVLADLLDTIGDYSENTLTSAGIPLTFVDLYSTTGRWCLKNGTGWAAQ